MTRFQHILFPVDSSERCSTVLPFVTALTQRFHARLTLMNVIQISTSWYGGFDTGFPVMIDLPELEEAAKNELDAFSKDSMVDKFVTVGDPAFEIVQFAATNDVDLIAMPTHGYGKFRSLLLGSVTAKVLHDAKCPVWTAPHSENPELGKHLITKSIMAAIDLASITVPLLQEFGALARDFQAKLRLAHAIPAAPIGMEDDFRQFLFNAAHKQIAKLQNEAGTNFEVCMEAGAISKVVREASLHHEADLIVLASGTLHEPFGRLRTNAYAIIRNAPCPVLSL
jgi:nucleotide-binding universal stress UspA family protein